MKTKITSALVLIVALVSLIACTEEPILPANQNGITAITQHSQPGINEEVNQ